MKRYAAICIGLATVLPVAGYATSGHWIGAAASMALGCLWLAGLRRGWQGTEVLGLAGFVGVAAMGVWLELAAPILLAGVVAALAAWDLDRFAQRLRSAGQIEQEPALVRAHLRRLPSVVGLGLLLGLAAGIIPAPSSFGWALGLGALAIIGLSRVIRAFNRAGE